MTKQTVKSVSLILYSLHALISAHHQEASIPEIIEESLMEQLTRELITVSAGGKNRKQHRHLH